MSISNLIFVHITLEVCYSFLLKISPVKIIFGVNQGLLIRSTSIIIYKSKLFVAQPMVKYHLVWHIGVIYAAWWIIMKSWKTFRKENRWCWWTLPSKNSMRIIMVAPSTNYLFACRMLPYLDQIIVVKKTWIFWKKAQVGGLQEPRWLLLESLFSFF